MLHNVAPVTLYFPSIQHSAWKKVFPFPQQISKFLLKFISFSLFSPPKLSGPEGVQKRVKVLLIPPLSDQCYWAQTQTFWIFFFWWSRELGDEEGTSMFKWVGWVGGWRHKQNFMITLYLFLENYTGYLKDMFIVQSSSYPGPSRSKNNNLQSALFFIYS